MWKSPRFWGAGHSNARMRAAGGLLLALAGVGVAACYFLLRPAPTATRADPVAVARELMAQGKYVRAADMLRAAFGANPSEETRTELAQALIASGDFEGALSTLRAAPDVSADPKQAYLLAEALIRLRRFAAASEMLEATSKGAANEKLDGAALLVAARAAHGLGRRGQARAYTSAALRAGGQTQGQAWLLRARLALDTNDLDTAKGAAARAREVGVPELLAKAVEIEALIRDGDFRGADEAIELLKRRAKKSYGDHQGGILAEYLAALLEASQGHFVDAARRLRPLEDWMDSEPSSALMLAMVLEGAGDVAQAERRLRAMHNDAPCDFRITLAYGGLLLRAGRLESAEQLAASAKAGAEGNFLKLTAALARQDDDRAIELAKQLALSAPIAPPGETVFGKHSYPAKRDRAFYERPAALVAAARTLFDGARFKALAAARSLTGENGGAAEFGLAGELYLASGADDLAAAMFERVLSIQPQSRAGLMGKIRTDLRAWNLDAAERTLGEAISSGESRLADQIMLARILLIRGRPSEAVELLAPNDFALLSQGDGPLIYGAALARAGEKERLVRFAEKMRRIRPAEPETATILGWAGLDDWAAMAARAAFVSAPTDKQRAEGYLLAMQKVGRGEQAIATLAEIALLGGPSDLEHATPETEASLEMLRRRYLSRAETAVAARDYALALARGGEVEHSMRVMREAVFWAAPQLTSPELSPRT